MSDDGTPGVEEALDEALMETHHLANLSGLDAARQARRRLVEAQSASSVARTRDRLEAAIEYLELARLERRDTAAGFVQARELVAYAEAGLQAEQPVPLRGEVAELVRSEPEREPPRSLEELRAEAAVSSYEQLRIEVTLDQTFRQLYRDVDADLGRDGPAGDLDPETALAVAGLEMDIERSLQGPDDVATDFEFLDAEDLTAAENRAADEPDRDGDDAPTGVHDDG